MNYKLFSHYIMKKTLLSALLLSSMFLMNSCLQDRDPGPQPDAGFLTIYHGVADGPAMDIFTEMGRINNSPLTYSNSFPYSQFYVGERVLRFTPSNAANTLLETTHTLEKDKVYSIFLVNRLAEMEAVKIEDKWEEPTSELAQIRIAHLSPDAGNIRIEIGDEEEFFGEKIEYQDFSAFKAIEKGKTSIKVYTEDGSEELISVDEIDIRGNRVYTLIVRGLKDPQNSNNPLSIQLMTNYIRF